MRLIVGISCLLLGVAMLSCRLEGPTAPREIAKPPAVEWVRTVDGWERPDTWTFSGMAPAAGPPPLHPLVVAAAQGLASALALVAFGRDED